MNSSEALDFVKENGIVLESAQGPAPNLAERIAGEPIRGSWWGHRKARQILLCSRAVRDSNEVLVCRLVGGKVTYVHRDLWAPLVKLRGRFDPSRLAAIREIHTDTGKHQIKAVPFPKWVPGDVMKAAKRLSAEEAARVLELTVLEL